MTLRIELENDWYIYGSPEYKKEYGRRYRWSTPLYPWEKWKKRETWLKELLLRDWYVWRSKEYIKEYNRRFSWCTPLLPWDNTKKKTDKLKNELIRDWYIYRSFEYLSEYARRNSWREPITMEQKLAWYKPARKIRKDKVNSKRTPEYRKEYQRKYQAEYRKIWIKETYTKESLLDKLALMRKEQWIIL